jgi:hypothetical protein
MLRYSIMADGTTANVRAVDAMPPGASTDSSVRAVEQWTFEPARDGDQSIEWHNNVAVVAFTNDGTPREATPFFAEASCSRVSRRLM